jgi:hypothetical protein
MAPGCIVTSKWLMDLVVSWQGCKGAGGAAARHCFLPAGAQHAAGMYGAWLHRHDWPHSTWSSLSTDTELKAAQVSMGTPLLPTCRITIWCWRAIAANPRPDKRAEQSSETCDSDWILRGRGIKSQFPRSSPCCAPPKWPSLPHDPPSAAPAQPCAVPGSSSWSCCPTAGEMQCRMLCDRVPIDRVQSGAMFHSRN